MAVHTKRPASAPPAEPAREKTGHLLLRGWCVFVVLLALGGTSWVHAFGDVATGVLTAVSGVVSVVLWLTIRPPVQGRRMPWLAFGYIAWAALSLLWSAWTATSAIARKSAVRGKRVSVRGDLGGRRLIKKKNL